MAALNLLRLARLTGDDGLDEQAAAQLGAFAGTVSGYPASYTFYLCALDLALDAPLEIVVAGQDGAADTEALLQALRTVYLPGATVLLKPTGEAGSRLAAPVTDPAALGGLLE